MSRYRASHVRQGGSQRELPIINSDVTPAHIKHDYSCNFEFANGIARGRFRGTISRLVSSVLTDSMRIDGVRPRALQLPRRGRGQRRGLKFKLRPTLPHSRRYTCILGFRRDRSKGLLLSFLLSFAWALKQFSLDCNFRRCIEAEL